MSEPKLPGTDRVLLSHRHAESQDLVNNNAALVQQQAETNAELRRAEVPSD